MAILIKQKGPIIGLIFLVKLIGVSFERCGPVVDEVNI